MMFHRTLSKFRARFVGAFGLLAALAMTNCCPPALLEHPAEKTDQVSAVEKKNP